MTIGIALTKAQLDADMATTALSIAKLLREIDQFQEFFNITPDATLTTLGYVAAEEAILRSAWATDAVLLASIIRGTATLGAVKDFRSNLFQLIGDGLA